MTAVRLSPLQRQVLEQLAHIRVAPEDAWMTTERLEQLVSFGSPRLASRLRGVIERLRNRDLIEYDRSVAAWRITDKGREALG